MHDIVVEIERLERGATTDFDLGIDLMKLAGSAAGMYRVRSPADKRKLLSVVASNFVVDGKNFIPTYRKPFDLLVKGRGCQDWLPD